MKKIQINIDWSVVFWISITILFLWLLAKAVGLIHTPWFVQAIPVIVGFFALIGVGRGVANYAFKVDNIINNVKDIKIDVKRINNELHSIDKRVAVLESKI